MIRLITYADDNMTISAENCVRSALKCGVDEAIRYHPGMLSDEFKRFNAHAFHEGARGAGYWIWKPYICYNEILTMQDGDILIYADSGMTFINSVHEIIGRMNSEFFFFSNGWKHVEWCKGDVLEAFFSDKDWEDYGELIDGSQIQASLLFFKVSQRTKGFIKEWLLYCQMPGLIDDTPSSSPNFPTFAEHRHDQAILTCLAIKWGIDYNNLWCDEIWSNQRYRWPHSDYPPIVKHHRRRNHEW